MPPTAPRSSGSTPAGCGAGCGTPLSRRAFGWRGLPSRPAGARFAARVLACSTLAPAEARECHKQLPRRSCSTASTHPSAVRGPTHVPPHLPPHHLVPLLPHSVVYLQKQENVTKQLPRRSCSTASTHPSAVRGPTQVPLHHLPPQLPQCVLLLPCLHACARERNKTTAEAQLLNSIHAPVCCTGPDAGAPAPSTPTTSAPAAAPACTSSTTPAAARECHKQLSRRSCSTASTHPSAVRGPTQVPRTCPLTI